MKVRTTLAITCKHMEFSKYVMFTAENTDKAVFPKLGYVKN